MSAPALLMFEWGCPECGDICYQKVPGAGDTLACPSCDFEQEVERVEVEDDKTERCPWCGLPEDDPSRIDNCPARPARMVSRD